MIEKSSTIGAGAATAAVKQTLVEEGTTFKGSLSSICPIVVKGRIEGDVAAPSLNVSTSGSVHGTVKVNELRSAGELSGDFESDTVTLSGVVKDNTRLRAKSLEVRLTVPNGKMQVLFGDCSLEVGDPLSKEDVIRQATQPAQPPAEPAKDTLETKAADTKAATKSEAPPALAKGDSKNDGKTSERPNKGKDKDYKDYSDFKGKDANDFKGKESNDFGMSGSGFKEIVDNPGGEHFKEILDAYKGQTALPSFLNNLLARVKELEERAKIKKSPFITPFLRPPVGRATIRSKRKKNR